MAMYSVFDLDTQRYDYFQAQGPGLGQRVHSRAKGLAGVTPDEVLPILPKDALHVGSGEDPRGILAVRGSFLGFGDDAGATATTTTPTGIPLPFIVEHPYISAGVAIGAIILLYKAAIYLAK